MLFVVDLHSAVIYMVCVIGISDLLKPYDSLCDGDLEIFSMCHTHAHAHTHAHIRTHNHFVALLDFVRDYSL